MREVVIVVVEPACESGMELLEAEPVAWPDEVFLEGAEDALAAVEITVDQKARAHVGRGVDESLELRMRGY